MTFYVTTKKSDKGEEYYVTCESWKKHSVHATFTLRERADEYAAKWTAEAAENDDPTKPDDDSDTSTSRPRGEDR